MKYLSIFSGIEAASVAWEPFGWTPVAFSEIDRYASCVLKHRFPDVQNWGDVTRFKEWPDEPVDLLVGGSPCQAFSVAGLRKGLEDPRGQLTLTYLAVVGRYRPRWMVWENVSGVLSADGGRAFGAFLRGLAELGYGFAWRVLDAQYVRVDGFCRAVPQRRRRVFLVGHSGRDWQRAGKVLFEPESLRWNSPPRRTTRKGITKDVGTGAEGSSWIPETGNTLTARCAKGVNSTLDEGQTVIAFDARQTPDCSDVCGTLDTHFGTHAVAFMESGEADVRLYDVCPTLTTGGGKPGQGYPAMCDGWKVRRLTPRECERLQGFPDDWTLVPGPNGKPMPDSQRYKMLGNSMAVNVMRWIGMRIDMVENGLL